MERIEGLVTKGQAIVAAQRTSLAFHDGPALTREYHEWEASLALPPGIAAGTLDERMKADLPRIMATWRRAPVPVS